MDQATSRPNDLVREAAEIVLELKRIGERNAEIVKLICLVTSAEGAEEDERTQILARGIGEEAKLLTTRMRVLLERQKVLVALFRFESNDLAAEKTS